MGALRWAVLLSTVLVITIAGATCGPPPWADWVASQPDHIKIYVTRDSQVVDWLSSWPLSNWVKAAAYIVFKAPMKGEDPTPEKVIQAAESNNINCSTNSVPRWGEMHWGNISESQFAEAVKQMNRDKLGEITDIERTPWGIIIHWKPIRNDVSDDSELFKAAVRIAYWVASKIPCRKYFTPSDMDWTEFTPLRVLKEYWRGWNCAGHAVLAVALMRAAMIPAKVAGGWVETPDGGGWHAWVAFYNRDGKWVHVDPTGDGNSYMQCRAQLWLIRCDDVEEEVRRTMGYYVNDHATDIGEIKECWEKYVKEPLSPMILVSDSASGGADAQEGAGGLRLSNALLTHLFLFTPLLPIPAHSVSVLHGDTVTDCLEAISRLKACDMDSYRLVLVSYPPYRYLIVFPHAKLVTDDLSKTALLHGRELRIRTSFGEVRTALRAPAVILGIVDLENADVESYLTVLWRDRIALLTPYSAAFARFEPGGRIELERVVWFDKYRHTLPPTDLGPTTASTGSTPETVPSRSSFTTYGAKFPSGRTSMTRARPSTRRPSTLRRP